MADQLSTKAMHGFEIKDADKGEVTAIVSVFNIVDRDGDVILPGAIRDGTSVKMSAYRHDIITEGKPPVGSGVLHVDGQKAVLAGRYFMSTERGREAFAQVKEMGTESEWSIGYFEHLVKTVPMTKEWRAKGARRIIAEIPVLESSPVFIGANQYTSTVATKGAESQADGEVDISRTLFDEVVTAIKAKVDADMMEAKRRAEDVATKAAADAEQARLVAESQERDRISALAAKEYERLQRNMRQHRVV